MTPTFHLTFEPCLPHTPSLTQQQTHIHAVNTINNHVLPVHFSEGPRICPRPNPCVYIATGAFTLLSFFLLA